MSSFYFCDAGKEKNVPNSAYKVYHVLLSLSNYQTGASFPSRKYIARQAQISESTVSVAIRKLKELGLISVKERFTVGRQTSNLYTILRRPDMQNAGKKLQIDTQTARKLPGRSLRVFCFLKANTAKDGRCGIYLKHIAKQIGKSIRTVQRYLKEMVEKGVLEIIHQKGKKSYYRLKCVADSLKNTLAAFYGDAFLETAISPKDGSILDDLRLISEQLGIGITLNVLI